MLLDSVHQIALLQNDLIGNQLQDWRQRQKHNQIGVPFDDSEQRLDDIQIQCAFSFYEGFSSISSRRFEHLAEAIWQRRTTAAWLLDLLRRGPNLPDTNTQQCIDVLQPMVDNFVKLLCVLISQYGIFPFRCLFIT